MTWRIARSLAVLLVGAVLASSPRARADEPAEEGSESGYDHFERGVEYVHDGDLRAALIEFKRAYASSPNYRVLYNLGQVSNELREYTEAQTYFRRYLTDGGNEIELARRREVEATLAKLQRRIASIVLSSNVAGAELFVDDVSVGKSPLAAPVRVSAGTRVIAAAVSGRPRISQVIEAAGDETIVVQLDFPASTRSEAPSGSRQAATASTEDSGTSPALWLGIGAGALAVATGVMAYLAASDASDYHDAVDRKTTARELEQLDERATAKALVTDILLGATVVTAGVTLIVALSDGDETEHARRAKEARAQLTVGAGSVGVRASF